MLITGISGSGGSYLAEYIVQNHPEVEIHGLSRWHSTTNHDNLHAVRDRVVIHECDLLDSLSILAALEKSQPDAIFHLASHANVRASFQTPVAVLENNILGTVNLFEAVRSVGVLPRFLLCSSSEVYGQVSRENGPINEDTRIRPVSPYAVSKATQDMLGYYYFVAYKIPVIITRMYAYLNMLRADLFATAFARQIARIELGLQKELVHGNLDSIRTIIDVRDAMRAYWEALLHCEPGEAYNIGGDTVKSVREVLNDLVSLAKVPIPMREEQTLLRPADVTNQIPNTKKFRDATGWKPHYSFQESLTDLLAHVRTEVAKEER